MELQNNGSIVDGKEIVVRLVYADPTLQQQLFTFTRIVRKNNLLSKIVLWLLNFAKED